MACEKEVCEAFVADVTKALGEKKIGDGTIIALVMAFIKANPALMQWGIAALIALITGGTVPPIPTPVV
jgi:hypothetical protein